MLAQNFKTAHDLNISDVELQSLIKVLGMLERQELVHGEYSPWFKIPHEPNAFNMAATLESDCGTIACMAGWSHKISGGAAFPEIASDNLEAWDARFNEPLISLFGIGKICRILSEITPAQAATALRSYLTTGEAQWELACA